MSPSQLDIVLLTVHGAFQSGGLKAISSLSRAIGPSLSSLGQRDALTPSHSGISQILNCLFMQIQALGPATAVQCIFELTKQKSYYRVSGS